MNEERKKIIVWDIDDTITDEAGFIASFGPKYFKKKYGVDTKLVDETAQVISDMFNLEAKLIEKGKSTEEINDILNYVNKKFIQKNYLRYLMFPLKHDSKKILDYTDQEYSNCFVTLRGIKPDREENFNDLLIRTVIVPMLTKAQLYLRGIKYDDILYAKSIDDKNKKIRFINPDMVFDDTPSVINNVKGATPVFVETKRNRVDEVNNSKSEVTDFSFDSVKELVDVNGKKITKRKNRHLFIKSLDVLSVNFKKFIYNLTKVTAGGIVNSKLNVKVNGQDNVPDDGNFIFVSNHRKSMDTVILIANSKKVINFAAIKYLFTGKKNLFGKEQSKMGCFLTKTLINATGSFPVARKNDEDYIETNLQADETMRELLLDYKNSIGFYPEGTHNKDIIKNGPLLPLVSDYVFELSSDVQIPVIPVAVSWPSAEMNSPHKVILSYGTPIVGNSKAELKELWVNNIMKMLEEQISENENDIILSKRK